GRTNRAGDPFYSPSFSTRGAVSRGESLLCRRGGSLPGQELLDVPVQECPGRSHLLPGVHVALEGGLILCRPPPLNRCREARVLGCVRAVRVVLSGGEVRRVLVLGRHLDYETTTALAVVKFACV